MKILITGSTGFVGDFSFFTCSLKELILSLGIHM
jgi:nucleoside-diphosphate-sugar epimerase